MELWKWELRKIWRPGILVVLVLLGGIFWQFRTGFYIEYFCNGGGAKEEFAVKADWVKRYGPTIEPSERAEIDGQLKESKAEFAKQLAAIPEAAEVGINNYEDFIIFEDAYYDRAARDGKGDGSTRSFIWRIQDNTNYYAIEAIIRFIEDYDELSKDGGSPLEHYDVASALEEKRQSRIQAIRSGPAAYAIDPPIRPASDFAKYLAAWCTLSVVVLLSPTLVRDQLHSTRPMQWASRRGRKIVNVQFGAALLSGLLLTLINFAVYTAPFLSTGALAFRDCWLASGISKGSFAWFDWTYGQYLLILAGLVLTVTMGVSALTVFLSQYSRNYTAMLFKALPLYLAVGWYFTIWVVEDAGMSSSGASWLLLLPGAEFLCAGVLLMLGLGLCALACRRYAVVPRK